MTRLPSPPLRGRGAFRRGHQERHIYMSRTTLCLLTAGGLAALSLALMGVRYAVLGDEVRVPAGPGTWKVTLLVHGRSHGEPRLLTLTPLDCGHQHVAREAWRSHELFEKPPDVRHP